MNLPWSTQQLTDQDEQLLVSLYDAHAKSAYRPNASSVAVANAAASSGEVDKAIVAGIMTLGGLHAPLRNTYRFLHMENPASSVAWYIETDEKVPGWGGTFQKIEPDPLWASVDVNLHDFHPELYEKICGVTEALHDQGRIIHPNPSAYTVAVALALKMPERMAVFLFIQARLGPWAQIALSNLDRKEI